VDPNWQDLLQKVVFGHSKNRKKTSFVFIRRILVGALLGTIPGFFLGWILAFFIGWVDCPYSSEEECGILIFRIWGGTLLVAAIIGGVVKAKRN
jgi:hypothetical protein